jgi:hypothetical protein
MTGIRFLDELSAPRSSTILPSQLQSAQRRASLQTETTLAGYAIAMAVDAPQLELYSHVAADLQKWIEHSKEIYRQAEGEAAKVTPMLFREYSIADEQTQAELLVSLPSSQTMFRELMCPCLSNNSSLSRPITMPRRDHSGMTGGCNG